MFTIRSQHPPKIIQRKTTPNNNKHISIIKEQSFARNQKWKRNRDILCVCARKKWHTKQFCRHSLYIVYLRLRLPLSLSCPSDFLSVTFSCFYRSLLLFVLYRLNDKSPIQYSLCKTSAFSRIVITKFLLYTKNFGRFVHVLRYLRATRRFENSNASKLSSSCLLTVIVELARIKKILFNKIQFFDKSCKLFSALHIAFTSFSIHFQHDFAMQSMHTEEKTDQKCYKTI